jgi:lipopolysaccharide transport system permease protein
MYGDFLVSDVKHFFDLVFYKAFAELRAESSRAMAGYLWWVLEPLMTLGVYFVVFSFLRPRSGENFIVFLFSGIVFWRWFGASVKRSATSLVISKGLMLQVDLHKMIPPLSIVIIDTIKFSVTFLLLVAIIFLSGSSLSAAWLTLPILLITQIFLIVGCSFFTAGITPLFPDFNHILSTILQLMMMCSGVFYPLTILPEKAQSLLMLNPMAVLILQYRGVFLHGVPVQIRSLGVVWLEIAVMLTLGCFLLTKYNKVYPKIS